LDQQRQANNSEPAEQREIEHDKHTHHIALPHEAMAPAPGVRARAALQRAPYTAKKQFAILF